MSNGNGHKPKLVTGAELASRKDKAEFVPSEQELEAYDRHLRGEPYASIAKDFDCDPSTIFHAYHRVKKWVVAQRVAEVFESRRDVEEQYRWILEECALAWHKSKEIKVVETNKVGDKDSSHTIRKEQTPGDPAYLAIAERAIEGRRALLGLDKPKVHDDGTGGIIRYSGKSRDEAVTEVIGIFRRIIRHEETEQGGEVIEGENVSDDGTT